MGLFKEQSLRLLRETWASSRMLAEELYAILNSDEPLTIDGPVTINNTGDSPALTIKNLGGGDTAIEIQRRADPSGPTTPGEPPADPRDDATTDVTNGGDVVNQATGAAGNTVPCVVLSRVGTSDTYFIELHENGADRGATRNVTAVNLTAGVAIPAGTATLASKVNRREADPATGRPTQHREDVWYVVAPAATATSFLGRVVSGTGDTYQVALHGNGSSQAATATVSATVPQIDAAETIPAGTWLAAVHAFTVAGVTVYEFQPPVWLSEE